MLSLCKFVIDEVQEEEVRLIFNLKLFRGVLCAMSVLIVISMSHPLLVTFVTQIILDTSNIWFEAVL